MRRYERSWRWVKEKKQMALVFLAITMVLQLQMKGCVGCLETERIGLLQLKSYLNSLFLKSWSDDDPKSDCCLWERVNCSDATGGHVIDLSLNQILPGKYGNTQRSLNLSLLHSFPQLKTLDFSRNGFDHLIDPIHGLENIVELKVLRLNGNKFNNTRSIEVLKDMPKLQELHLSDNGFTDLDSLCELLPSSLQVLGLKSNQLSSTPKGYSKICALRNLRELDLGNNALTNLPYCLGNLSRLRTLELSSNQLNGNLSFFVAGLPSALEYLSLLDNNFNGSFLFNSLVNQTRLTVFRLSSKVGTIQAKAESSWVPLFQLKILRLHNVILGSTIPGFLIHQHELWYVNLSYNELTGAFPTWLVQNNTRLQKLLLNSNALTKLQLPRLVHGLQLLDISSNEIQDSIQEDIGIVFPEMSYMDFSSNHFHGTIPSSMGEMKSLITLGVSSNGLYGELPKTFLSSCYSLEVLKLSNNKLQEEIFPEQANLTRLLAISWWKPF